MQHWEVVVQGHLLADITFILMQMGVSGNWLLFVARQAEMIHIGKSQGLSHRLMSSDPNQMAR